MKAAAAAQVLKRALPCVCIYCRVIAGQLLDVLCSMSNLLAEQDTALLQELHVGTVDLLLGECDWADAQQQAQK